MFYVKRWAFFLIAASFCLSRFAANSWADSFPVSAEGTGLESFNVWTIDDRRVPDEEVLCAYGDRPACRPSRSTPLVREQFEIWQRHPVAGDLLCEFYEDLRIERPFSQANRQQLLELYKIGLGCVVLGGDEAAIYPHLTLPERVELFRRKQNQ